MARYREDKEYGPDRHMGLLKLVQILSFLVIFVAGIIIGLATSSHINQYFTSQARLFFTNNIAATKIPGDNCTILKPCKAVDCLSMETFLHPKNLTHRMTDQELFWRASLMPYKDEYPFNRVPKVAFLFLTRGPLPMLPLWERFFRSHEKYFAIYVHTPRNYVLNVSTDSPFYGRQIPSQDVEWGSVSLVDAEKRLLSNALLDFSNERFVLLSESCIPVYNFPTVYRYLIHSEYSFVESYDDPTRYGRGRYNRKMLPDIRLYQWRKGSQWFEIQRALAVYMVSDTKYYSIFKRYCRPACYPDEHYIPTYLNMFHGSLNANRTVTWVDWSFGGPHPATYMGINVTESFIQSIRNNKTQCSYNSEMTSVCYLFARKFHPSALEPLLNLTSTVMEF
ncbi:glycosyltransferase BC10 isoform X1 [Ricinus communis]|uniref:glycosyltransferase BC10 isoform X1 n=1 Tax=Ricinus communis TaxID=3988 RepID=UPI00201B25BF|nr:glycosyltransferase BC10 isoform X1 [Ricinus communis]